MMTDEMTNVCSNCGAYRSDKNVDPEAGIVICPECSHTMPLEFRPLFVVGGPSGAGKSTVLTRLVSYELPVVVMDCDILWEPRHDSPESNYREFFEMWLRIARNIHQSGRPCVLFAGGGAVPHNIEPCVERRYVSDVYYLALIAKDEVLRKRLKARPTWRGSSHDAFIRSHLEYSRWLTTSEEAARYGITIVDTSTDAVETTTAKVADWICAHLGT
jgi:2-phosphoglycerate kinase